MPIIDMQLLLRQAFIGAGQVKGHAFTLRNWPQSTIKFDTLRDRMTLMRSTFEGRIQPVLDLNDAVRVNADAAALFIGAPANTDGALRALRTDLITFYQAYEPLFNSLIRDTFSVANGHQYADVPLSQLAPLADEMDAVIAAASVFD